MARSEILQNFFSVKNFVVFLLSISFTKLFWCIWKNSFTFLSFKTQALKYLSLLLLFQLDLAKLQEVITEGRTV